MTTKNNKKQEIDLENLDVTQLPEIKSNRHTPMANDGNKRKALYLRVVKGWSYQRIAKLYGIGQACVYKALKPLLAEADLTNSFAEMRAWELQDMQRRVAKSIKSEKIEKAGLGETASALKKLYEMERIETGKVSAISGHVDMLEAIRLANKDVQK